MYQLPLPDSAGRAIRSRAEVAPIPIYVASLGPANLALTGELADGWIGNSFFTDERVGVLRSDRRRCGRSAGRSLDDVDRVVAVSLELTDDDPAAIEAAGRRHADGYAFTFGAMGTASKNFYNDAFARQGYRRRRRGGPPAVGRRRPGGRGGTGADRDRLRHQPVGPPTMVKQRLVDYERAGVTTLRINLNRPFDRLVAELEILLDLADQAGRRPHRQHHDDRPVP